MNAFTVEINYEVEGGTPGGVTGVKELKSMSEIIDEVTAFLGNVGVSIDLETNITIKIKSEAHDG